MDEIRPPRPDERGAPDRSRDPFNVAIVAIVLAAAIALAVIAGAYIFRSTYSNRQTIESIDVKALVERIIKVESAGIANKKNKLSSATGAGQFLDDTWLEAIRKHRRDLIKGRSDKELLELRQDAELTREIIARLLEQYARTLNKRGLPLTSGSLYLAYFAGPAGAVALLSGAEHADAASVMAAADATGRTTRQKLVRANPFLEVLTVRDLKNWADHKMRGI
ncbi:MULTISPECIES: lytic transglycosylase domain-containing protein [unclassified Bradyrhizobium]|uniref:lytic transglycosylase domain-containing protein n=1 Tax=unclassified Bradyrhizobium TaxID=2631580 RepID=UPI002897FF11|nr:lytic transglycosylase domain-containing protein [Bradyrhizobium sp. AUGA SZCCT0182]